MTFRSPPIGLLLLLGLAAFATPAGAALLSGTVVDRDGKPVEFATIAVPALKLGAASDEHGRFELMVPPGRVMVEFAQIGYQRARLEVDVTDTAAPLRVVLSLEPVPVAEVTVAASSFGKAGKSEGAVVRRMDIVGTPGGAADIFQALRALPGINAPNEGAALYVRGGDPRETMIRLDGGEIGHPYHYEGASGGLFSTIDSYMLKSAFFSSGGFSSKYGGVLSGVLDIETQDPMNLRTVSVGANLAGGGLSSSWALVPDRLSFVGSLSHGAPELLFKLYGSPSEYQTAPSSMNGLGKLLARYSGTGRLALEYLESHDRVGVRADYLNATHQYSETSENHFLALNLQEVVAGKLALRGQASLQRFDTRWSYGPFGAGQRERNAQGNLDAVWPLSARHELSFGINARHRDTEIVGLFPADSTDYLSGAPTRQHVTRPVVDYPGFYLEEKLRLWGPLYATLGARFDYASTPAVWTSDPRAALAWRVDDHQTIRIASGRYHQLADPRFLDPAYGYPDLAPLRADHVIAAYEWKSDYGNVRVEGFRKDYRDLVTQDSSTFYANRGHGYARGVDVFVQGTYHWLSGWLSYGYLDTRRRELDDPTEVPASYGVRHSLTLVTQYQATSSVRLGARYTVSAGRPFTPVVDATYDPARDLWRPTYGDHNSARFPGYHRLDVRLTRLFSLPKTGRLPASSVCVFYVEGMNVLGIRNVLDYVYNSDYTGRFETESYFSRRLLVAGFSLTW